jgi:hypothetical protein
VTAESFDRFVRLPLSSRSVIDEVQPLDETSNEYSDATKQAFAFIYCLVEFVLLMSRADLSKHLLAFERGSNMPPTLGQRHLSTRVACSHPHAGTADKSHTKTWWRRLDSSSSHIAKLCERLPVPECRPRLAPINFRASGTLSNARRITLTRIQQFRVTFLTLSRAINRSNGIGLKSVKLRLQLAKQVR